MSGFDKKAQDFLAQTNIAVVGVSRASQDSANAIYKALREKNYHVFPVNPNAETVEGDQCYPNLAAIPEKLDGVMIVTRPEVTDAVAEECVSVGVPRVWIHHNPWFGGGSMSSAAVANLEQHGVSVIAGGCPLMFIESFHKFMKTVMKFTGQLPT